VFSDRCDNQYAHGKNYTEFINKGTGLALKKNKKHFAVDQARFSFNNSKKRNIECFI
jgi:hypothetical protein